MTLRMRAKLLPVLVLAAFNSLFDVACDRSDDTPVYLPQAAKTMEADFVELYTVSKTQDEDHQTLILDKQGTVWYRSEHSGFDLSYSNAEEAFVARSPKGGFHVRLSVKESHVPRLEEWSRARIGQRIGLALDGRLIHVQRLRDDLSYSISVTTFSTEAEAERVCHLIQAWGILNEGK